jgi:hypothetical protein
MGYSLLSRFKIGFSVSLEMPHNGCGYEPLRDRSALWSM